MDAVFKREVFAVRQLGEQIGYGNMMAIACALWQEMLSKDGVTTGAHIPVTRGSVRPERMAEIENELRRMQNLVMDAIKSEQ